MKSALFVSLVFVSFALLGRNEFVLQQAPPPEYDVSNDTMFFDLSKSVISGSGPYYIDIPVFVRSKGPISNFDFWFKFNKSDVTYVSTLNLVSALDPFTFFNSTNDFLSNTTSGPAASYTIPMNTNLIYVRFQLAGSCTLIDATDFSSITTLLNGSVCKHKIIDIGSGATFMQVNPAVLCDGDTSFFKGPAKLSGKTVTNWSWDFGNGQSALDKDSKAKYAKGNYTVTLTTKTSDGCVYINYKDLSVGAIPKIQFTYTVSANKDTVRFTNQSESASYAWDFGDNAKSTAVNPIHLYAGGGTFNVTLSAVLNGCSNTLTKSVVVDRPTALFTYSGKCTGDAIVFTNKSSYAFGTISSYAWDFGDGNTSTLSNPMNSYGVAGDYTVSLTVTANNGLQAKYLQSIAIDNRPVVLFTADKVQGCAPFSFQLTNKSLAEPASMSYWNFGDDSFSLDLNPKKSYAKAGKYNVKLTVSSPNGCVDSLSKTNFITVLESPKADFTHGPACSTTDVEFSEIAQTGSPSVLWEWNFGNGKSGTGQKTKHLYLAEGNYQVELRVKNAVGCKDSLSRSVFVRHRPKANFSASDLLGCVPLKTTFTNASIATPGSFFAWDFGNGDQSAVQQPTEVFGKSGKFSVRLITSAPGGCADTLTKVDFIEVLNGVTANFAFDQHCVGNLTEFSDLSVASPGKVAKWEWDFGNGFTSAVQNPKITFTSPGSYAVKLAVTTNQGCSDTLVKKIEMDPKPLVDFSVKASNGCLPHQAVFSNETKQATGASYLWMFGDGGTATTENPTHVYSSSSASSFSVSLFVLSSNGCKDSLIRTSFIKLESYPTAAFFLLKDTLFFPESIAYFDNQSVGSNTYNWDFGDGFASELFEPSHLYNDTGKYAVCLSVLSPYGCAANFCDTLVVLKPSAVALPTAFTPNGDGVNDHFKVRGGPFISFEMQVFNQWGNLVFRSTDPSVGWDGTFSGQPQPSGAYEYVIKGTSPGKEDLMEYGVINLKRY